MLLVAAVAVFGIVPAALACVHPQPPQRDHWHHPQPPTPSPQPAPPAPPSATQPPGPVVSSSSTSTATASPVVTIVQNVVNTITVTVVEKVPAPAKRHPKRSCGCHHKKVKPHKKTPPKKKACHRGAVMVACSYHGPTPTGGNG